METRVRQVLVVAVVAAVLGGCADGQPGVTPVPAPPTTGPASPAPAAGEQRSLPVYYVADTPNGLRLHLSLIHI